VSHCFAGGERKRTSVGVEIITNPSIIFLDEPISGLDSYGGYSLICLLKQIAQSNGTILFTIHQPSSEIFFLLDKVLFLKAGRVVYLGSVHLLVEHFNSFGYCCPPNYNPSDYVMFICQTESEEDLNENGVYPPAPAETTELAIGIARTPPPGDTRVRDCCLTTSESLSEFFKQISWISWRDLTSTVRNKPALLGRFGVVIVINILFAFIFRNAAGRNDANQANFQGHLGAVTIVASAAMFNTAMPALVNFPAERVRFIHESIVGTYSAGSYMIGKTLVEIPLTFLQAIVQTTVVYWTIRFRGFYLYLILILWGIASTSASLAILLGCLLKDPKQAIEFAPLIFVPQLLYVGFYIRTSLIPVYIRWIQYLCPLKYGVNLAFLNEYHSVTGAGAIRNWSLMLSKNAIEPSDWWVYVLIMLGIYCGCKVVSSYALSRMTL
jgi:energy-coupling factor transporter ATP-binding protein EcfA2/ABC-type multidrug transport system permease subunit